MKTRIVGTGNYLPDNVLTNDDLSKMVDTSDEWIRTRTGICQRRIAKEDTTYSMGAGAAKEALKQAEIAGEEIDLIIVATSSAEYAFPNTASLIQSEIGAKHALCFDVSVACTGFIVAMSIADSMMCTGNYRKALVIGSEVLSSQLDWSDRSVCVLFGDGAGAVVMENSESDGCGLIDQEIHSDGNKGMVLTCGKNTADRITADGTLRTNQTIQMNGQEVFKFAVKKVPESIQTLLDRNHLSAEDVDYYILHQANKRIIESVAKRLHVSIEKFPMNLDRYGNTSAASIPILLHELSREHILKPGDLVILSGFGGGLSWGSLLIRL